MTDRTVARAPVPSAAAAPADEDRPRLVASPPSSLSLRNRAGRALWSVVWLVLFRPSPRTLHGWRRLLLRVFGATVGRGVRVYPSARIWAPWNLEMREHACLGDFVDCYSVDRIVIGARATVSQYSFLCTASHDFEDARMPLTTAPITIGDEVWVTADVFVAPGVTIGSGAVIYARSSVFRDVPTWTVAAGSPAKPLRERRLYRPSVPYTNDHSRS
jgi:putative colanic acid biosynthesis acetyltransferase WcaF